MPYLSSSTNSLDSDMCGVAEGGERNRAELNLEPCKEKFPITNQLQGWSWVGGADVQFTARVDKGPLGHFLRFFMVQSAAFYSYF